LLQWFTTNGFYIGLNTNYGSAYSNSVVNIINSNVSASPQVWTNANGYVYLNPTVATSNRIILNATNGVGNALIELAEQRVPSGGGGAPWGDGQAKVLIRATSWASVPSTNARGESVSLIGIAGNGTVNYGVAGVASPDWASTGGIST